MRSLKREIELVSAMDEADHYHEVRANSKLTEAMEDLRELVWSDYNRWTTHWFGMLWAKKLREEIVSLEEEKSECYEWNARSADERLVESGDARVAENMRFRRLERKRKRNDWTSWRFYRRYCTHSSAKSSNHLPRRNKRFENIDWNDLNATFSSNATKFHMIESIYLKIQQPQILISKMLMGCLNSSKHEWFDQGCYQIRLQKILKKLNEENGD